MHQIAGCDYDHCKNITSAVIEDTAITLGAQDAHGRWAGMIGDGNRFIRQKYSGHLKEGMICIASILS